jgi:hypothetical protein
MKAIVSQQIVVYDHHTPHHEKSMIQFGDVGIEVLRYHSSTSCDEGCSRYKEKMENDNANNCRLKDPVPIKPLKS